MAEHDCADLKEYKVIETRLYGEIMKTCRRYSNELSLISLLGILDIVKQEIQDLDKTTRIMMDERAGLSQELSAAEKKGLDSLH